MNIFFFKFLKIYVLLKKSFYRFFFIYDDIFIEFFFFFLSVQALITFKNILMFIRNIKLRRLFLIGRLIILFNLIYKIN